MPCLAAKQQGLAQSQYAKGGEGMPLLLLLGGEAARVSAEPTTGNLAGLVNKANSFVFPLKKKIIGGKNN